MAAGDFSAKASAQIAALQSLKSSLSPSEKKLDSRLAVELRKRQGKVATAALPDLRTGVQVSKSGTTRVTIHASKVTSDLLNRLGKAGAEVRFSSESMHVVTVDAPLSALSGIASWSDVTKVAITTGAMTAHEAGPAGAAAKVVPESKEAKAARIAKDLRAAQAAGPIAAAAGSVDSEGDVTHAADKARAKFKVTGTGVKVCVLSDGVDSLLVAAASGDLPPDVDVLPGQAGSGDEGTAMLEIVHDLAPHAKLGFATAFTSEESFAQNILDLRSVGHCDIIVDDVIYFDEDPFQDGLVAQSVNTVTADGAFYFSSAGNDGNTIDGTAGNYEGDFVSSGRGVAKFAGSAHDFDPGPGVQAFEPLSAASADVPVTLFWADPLGHAADDYDLYELDGAGNVVAVSQDVQDGNDDPLEIFGSDLFTADGRLAVVKFSGADRYFQLSALRGRFVDSPDGLHAFSTPGVTRGHSAAVDAFSVAAAPAADPLPFDLEEGDPPNPAGPFPGVFTKQSKLERFTSDGPRRVFFNADGTPVTPGNTTHTGGVARPKPDITAADGVSTTLDPSTGLNPFFGTSAAAPHAAAIAALALSGNPGMSQADMREALTGTALDLASAGFDNRSGFGVIRADTVLKFTGATPQPLVEAGTPVATPVTGDGDAFLEPGEQGSLAFPAVNNGDGTATGVSVVLSTDDSRATVTPRVMSYGSIKAGETKTKNYTLTLAADYPNGRPVGIRARITFAGRLSPTTATKPVQVGHILQTSFAYTGAPVAIPDFNSAGASATVTVANLPAPVSSLTFSIDGTTCTADAGATTVGLDHTFMSDLTGTVTAPDGTTATLFAGNGSSGNNFCQVVFDDTATRSIRTISSAGAPFTGTYTPLEPLTPLLAGPLDGTWTFHVVDDASADVGSIRAFSLHFSGLEPA